MKRLFILLIAVFIGFGTFYVYPNFVQPDGFIPVEQPVNGTDSDDVPSSPNVRPTQTKRLNSSSLTQVYSKENVNSLTRGFNGGTFLPSEYDIHKYTVRFNSTDENGRRIQIVSQMFVPVVEGEIETFPIYVFGQGTTGLSNMCAPSREVPEFENWGNYVGHMLSYASQGYIVMFPDYAGFNDSSRIHHYFTALLEAHVLLDATRATYEFFDEEDLNIQPADDVFYAGYSQGGHAAYAVADYADSYAPDLMPKIKGAISYGGTTDIPNLLRENSALAPYLVYAYSDFYGTDVVDPADILRAELLTNFETTVLNTCIGQIYQKYSGNPQQVYNQRFHSALFNNTLESEFPELHRVFQENSTGLKESSIPTLNLQGSTDPIVTVRSQKEFMNKSCAAGNQITYIEYPGVHHYQTRQVSYRDALQWMETLMRGEQVSNYCAR